MIKSFRQIGMWLLLSVSALAIASCDDDKPNDTTPPDGNDDTYVETVPEKIVFTNAVAAYFGDEYGEGVSDGWSLSLYTDMEIDDIGNPIGPGHILRLSCNAPVASDQKADLSLLAGEYVWQTHDGDFSPHTFIWGYKLRLDLPTGAVYVDDGTFYGKVEEGSTAYDSDLLNEGSFTITKIGEGKIAISGILVGNHYVKRYVQFEGDIKINTSVTPAVPNSTLTQDLNITDFTQARLEDGGDVFFLQDNSYRMFTLMLGSKDVDLTELVPAGTGNVMQVDFFVAYDTKAADGIPAGTYNMTVRTENKGIDRTNIVPFNITPGYPDKFTLPSGTWYFGYENGVMENYACINGGKMIVERNGAAHNITMEFTDLSDNNYKVTTTYSATEAIPLFKR